MIVVDLTADQWEALEDEVAVITSAPDAIVHVWKSVPGYSMMQCILWLQSVASRQPGSALSETFNLVFPLGGYHGNNS